MRAPEAGATPSPVPDEGRGKEPRAVVVALVLAVVSFVVYNLNFREVSMDDSIPNRFLPLSILAEGDLDLDEFTFLHENETDQKKLPYYLQYRDGHYYSSYPILPGLMALPVYVVPLNLKLFDIAEPDFSADVSITSKVAASIIAALSVCFVYLAARRLYHHRWALGAALIYAFATGTFSTSSQGLWQHGPAQFWLAVALWCLLTDRSGNQEREPGLGLIALGGLSLALAVAARSVMAVPAVVLTGYLVQRNWRSLPLFLAGPVAVAGLLAWYNTTHFGTILGGEAYLGSIHGWMHNEQGSWTTNFLPGLYGFLFSANRGLVVFTPVVFLAVAGAERAWRRGQDDPVTWLAVAAAATVLLYGFYTVWWGGWSYGPRYGCDILPLLGVMMAGGLQRAWPLRRARVAVIVAVVFSVSVQLVGFLSYTPGRWNLYGRWGDQLNVDLYHQRLWDWGDWMVLRYLRAGLAPTVFGEKALCHSLYADGLQAEGDLRSAEEHYLEALYWDPDDVRGNTGLGVLLLGRGELDAAGRYLERAVEAGPTDPAALHNLGYYQLQREDLQSAVLTLARAIHVEPTRSASWRYLAVAYYRLGRRGEALKAARAGLALDPEDETLLELAADVAGQHAQAGDPD